MWDKIKRIFHFISTVLLYSVFVILILIFIAFLLYFVDQQMAQKSGQKRAPLFGAYVIISNSMVPNINVDDAVVTMRVSASSIKKGDVITFVSNDPSHTGVTITHRVIGISKTDDGKIAFRTKGDNNNVEDRTLINYDNVLGKVLVRIPFLGKIQKFLTTSLGWIVLIVVPALSIIISDILKLSKNLKAEKQEIEEKKIITKKTVKKENTKKITKKSNSRKKKDDDNSDDDVDHDDIVVKK